MRINDLVLGLVMALLGAITVWASQDFNTLPRQSFGAGSFPILVGSLLIFLGLLLALRSFQQHRVLFSWQGQISLSHTLACLVAVVVAVAGYALLTPILGFPLVAPVMLTLLIGWLSKGRWSLALIIAIVSTILIWIVFAQLLHVPLALGILEEVVY